MEFYVKTIKALMESNGLRFTEGDSVIIKYTDTENKKVHVKRGNIDKVGGIWMYLNITPWVWNHTHKRAWCCNRKIKIKNILTIKHFKNVLD